MVARDKEDNLIVLSRSGKFYESIVVPDEAISLSSVSLAWSSPPFDSPGGSKTRAYWVSNGQLVRRDVFADGSQGPKKVLTSDAAAGYSVAVARTSDRDQRDVVVYVGYQQSEPKERVARIWVDGQASRPVSTDSGGASSVAILPLGPRGFVLLTLDGRLAISPVHAVSVDLDEQGRPNLGDDKVVYVSGPSERYTAITGLLVGQRPVMLLPTSKTTLEFGMMVYRVGDDQDSATWVDYPNGLDPAPIAVSNICGVPAVAYAHHSTSDGGSDKLVEVGWFDESLNLVDRQVIDSARTIYHVAMWGDSAGGVIVYSTPTGLRGRQIGCK